MPIHRLLRDLPPLRQLGLGQKALSVIRYCHGKAWSICGKIAGPSGGAGGCGGPSSARTNSAAARRASRRISSTSGPGGDPSATSMQLHDCARRPEEDVGVRAIMAGEISLRSARISRGRALRRRLHYHIAIYWETETAGHYEAVVGHCTHNSRPSVTCPLLVGIWHVAEEASDPGRVCSLAFSRHPRQHPALRLSARS
jgi:hypothetical protein